LRSLIAKITQKWFLGSLNFLYIPKKKQKQKTCRKNKNKRNKLKKNVSFESDTESRFVTPDSSPERAAYYDDNKSLDAILAESVNSLNRILLDCQLAYENVTIIINLLNKEVNI
jgi:hypothetical protein